MTTELLDIRLFLKENNQLYLSGLKDIFENKEIEVNIKKCFPWSHQDKFLSFRNKDDEEVLLLPDINQLDDRSREDLLQFLSQSDFMMKITDIISIEEEVELRNFKVITSSGIRNIQTKLDDWPKILKNGSVMIQDLCGDTFVILSIEHLESAARKLIGTYVS
ncbi:MAG: DUF1854 domain-containing protein [Bacteriovoracaceae bacterium]|nr:DUF1854 domain-containing protein [Bacteriovoracaceae bacterium]